MRCSGLTNYQKALHDALQEFSQPGLGSKNKHLLFLTDGAPTQGDSELEDEQAWAKRLGVSIHTVFIGSGEYPAVLDTLALSTNGARFQAIPEYETGVIRLWDRGDGPPPASVDAAAEEASRAATDTGGREAADANRQVWPNQAGVRGEAAYDAFATDTLRPGERSALQRDENLAAKGRLSKEEMEKAMKLMAMGRSPVSGNAVTGKGRFG